jgi:hypothetical protein
MADSTIKQLTVTGTAAESFLNKGSRRRRRSSANKTQKQSGGEEPLRANGPVVASKQEGSSNQNGGTSPGTIVQLQANKAPDAPSLGPNAISQAKASNATALSKSTTNSTSAPVSSETNQLGGKKPVKVILGKKKTKVILTPAKVRKLPAPVDKTERGKTRKVAKKIRVSLQGLNKRVTRANHIRKDAFKQPIDAVKKTLVSAKLIKPDSKAPEDILRKMYADYMMLKNRAL